MFQEGMVAIILLLNFLSCNRKPNEKRERSVRSISGRLDAKQILLDEDVRLRGQQVEHL